MEVSIFSAGGHARSASTGLLSLGDKRHVLRHQFSVTASPTGRTAQTLWGQFGFVSLKHAQSKGSVYVPSFDHGVGDPIENDIFVSLQHKVVIVEGNYLFLEEGTWKDISSTFDEKWFLEVDIDKAMQRVLKRHISTGETADVAKQRIEYNDRPNAEFIMQTKQNANLIIRDDLGRFVAEKRCLSSLKIEGCTNLGSLNLCSSSLSTLWLSDLFSISKMAFNCPNLKELSLDFSRQENDSTDLINMVDVLGRSCLKLRNIHIASIHLSHSVVLALTSANLRSSISDSGIGMICNVFPHTLSRLLLALCPNVTSSGIQFAAAQLPHLRLFDCGMTICDPSVENPSVVENGLPADNSSQELKHQQKVSNTKLYPMYQKLIIKQGRLKKLSLWGCSGLDALYLNCPELNDLNLNSCTNLHPERVLLQCPCLESVQASGCRNKLIGAIQNQVYNESAEEDYLPSKRLADGSKRVHVPRLIIRQPSDGDKERALRPRCIVHVD
ncbi:hypothetical protein MRB53_020406 [Persea americana]|uniref:Uncharacterized protein n=1 Tax=Persea americana TaxID=3435 RepID=A0ACC2L0V1_PERAE|nr:hypothetical protein MRB53_020406 [Persea americana]